MGYLYRPNLKSEEGDRARLRSTHRAPAEPARAEEGANVIRTDGCSPGRTRIFLSREITSQPSTPACASQILSFSSHQHVIRGAPEPHNADKHASPG